MRASRRVAGCRARRRRQGRTVPATTIPWLRARETCIHVVDLGTGVTFADLPAGFLSELCDEVAGTRAGSGLVVTATDTGARWELAGPVVALAGPVSSVAAYLTGRPSDLTTVDGEPGPDLPAWL
jgi:maleylpyruvate isomerase